MGSSVVLLAEDNDGVRKLICLLLTQRGYTVLEASNGAMALELAERFQGIIHLLITDIQMPGINGMDLADELCRRHVHLKVLYISGFRGDVDLEDSVCARKPHFMGKPFSNDGFLKKVDEAFQNESGHPPLP